jgi:hypothetical protein
MQDASEDIDPQIDGPTKMGRPTKYKPEMAAQAEKLCALGATDADIADFFGVNIVTVHRWKSVHPEFCNALKVAKEVADQRVERSLYQRAIGYEMDAVKIFQYEGKEVIVPYRENVQPDTTAAIFWLKNRKPEAWKDRKDVTSDNRHHHTAEPVSPFADFVAAALGARAKGEAEEPVQN